MPKRRRRSPARLLAPVALLVFAFAFYLVLNDSSVTGDGNGSSPGATTTEPAATERARREPKPRRKAASYTVKAGDSLGAIAGKTGVEVEALQELNPEVDAQALTPGQKLKLRE